ncbi:Yqey-like protein-domain-containing protein [Lophiotrema nucula]|uniref:Altered inheritance of mitochondria protein 41 n=1 Tax=Lophiotrema nucula TaxID=690887 RepID=A0A6A5Z554_9PLEO|nr:Yqey-like protein-domain-containing protein [Lophiotrema nucula]
MSLLYLARPRITFYTRCLRTFTTATLLRTEASTNNLILSRLKDDLKSAMRAKDKPRLNVLRAILAEITNASKTPKPIESDTSLLSLLQKQITASQKAIEEFESAKRQDLVDKEREQVEILQGYEKEIPKLSDEDFNGILEQIKKELEGKEAKFGQAMKALVEKIAGRPVDMGYVTRKIKEAFPSGK